MAVRIFRETSGSGMGPMVSPHGYLKRHWCSRIFLWRLLCVWGPSVELFHGKYAGGCWNVDHDACQRSRSLRQAAGLRDAITTGHIQLRSVGPGRDPRETRKSSPARFFRGGVSSVSGSERNENNWMRRGRHQRRKCCMGVRE